MCTCNRDKGTSKGSERDLHRPKLHRPPSAPPPLSTLSTMKAGSRYRNVFGKEAKVKDQYDGLRVFNNAWDADAIAVSDKFIAVPFQGGGGPVVVMKHDQVGKLPAHHSIAGHKGNVLDFK